MEEVEESDLVVERVAARWSLGKAGLEACVCRTRADVAADCKSCARIRTREWQRPEKLLDDAQIKLGTRAARPVRNVVNGA